MNGIVRISRNFIQHALLVSQTDVSNPLHKSEALFIDIHDSKHG